MRELTSHLDPVSSVVFSSDKSTLASGSYNGLIKLWDVWTGQELQTLIGHSGSIQSISFSSDGLTLASGSYDGSILVWDLQTGDKLQTPKSYSVPIQSVANPSPTETRDISVSPGCHSPTHLDPQISLVDSWINIGDKKLICLPPEYRVYSSSAVNGATMALGYNDGRVLIIGFDVP
ncbi:WD40-repeat-containing domain protein [Aspergillus navahoensis]